VRTRVCFMYVTLRIWQYLSFKKQWQKLWCIVAAVRLNVAKKKSRKKVPKSVTTCDLVESTRGEIKKKIHFSLLLWRERVFLSSFLSFVTPNGTLLLPWSAFVIQQWQSASSSLSFCPSVHITLNPREIIRLLLDGKFYQLLSTKLMVFADIGLRNLQYTCNYMNTCVCVLCHTP